MRLTIGAVLVTLGLVVIIGSYLVASRRIKRNGQGVHWVGIGSVIGMTIACSAMAVWERWILAVMLGLAVVMLVPIGWWMVRIERGR